MFTQAIGRHAAATLDDLRYAVRRLRGAPAFASLTISTIGLGIGATTAIFTVVNAVVLRPIPIHNVDRVVRMYETNPSNDAWTTSEPNYLDYRDRTRSFSTMAAVSGRGASLLGHGDPVALSGTAATASFFSVFGGRPLLGSVYGPDNDRVGGDTRVIVLGEGIWRRIFGADPRLIGTTINLDGIPYRVVGVMPVGYGFVPSDFWVPLAPDPSSNRGSHLLVAFGFLKDGITVGRANADIRTVASALAREYPKSNGQWGARIESFEEFIVGKELRRELVVLMAAVAFLLLLSCANVANLLLASASTRKREMAVRAALGAEGGRLARQLLTESLVSATLGAAIGLGLTRLAIPIVRRASVVNLPRLEEVSIDLRVLGFAVTMAIGTGVVFGLAPAMHAARTDLQSALREGGRSIAGAGRRMREALVAIEVALAVMLLVGAGLLGRSFLKLEHVPTGFDDAGVLQLTVTAPNDLARDRRAEFFDRIEAELASVPGATAVGASSIAPFSGGNTNTQFLAEGHDATPNEYFAADWRSVTPGVFRVLHITLVHGRLLGPTDDKSHPNVAVIDETMASRLWPGQNPIGKHIVGAQSARGPGDQVEVVGVVRDVRDQSLAGDPGPAVYFPEPQKPWAQLTFFVKLRGRSVLASFTESLRYAVKRAAPATPAPDITPLSANVDTALAPQRFMAGLLTGFAGIALLLAAIGLYGVISFGVQQRASEMGIRLAFGAPPARLVAMVMREAGIVVAIGLAIGCGGALALTRLIASLLFATSATDVATYGTVVILLVAVAAVAAWRPAFRAARTDPLLVMRG